MALSTDPRDLMEEVKAAERLRDEVMQSTEDLIKNYHGKQYRTQLSPTDPVPENYAYQYLSLVTPRVIYDNPTVNVKSRRSGKSRKLIKGFEHGLNRWSRDVNLWRHLHRVWYDMAFAFGVMRTTLQPIPGRRGSDGQQQFRPIAKRVDPSKFIIDPKAQDQAEARLIGHQFSRDLDDLIEDERYDQQALEQMGKEAGVVSAIQNYSGSRVGTAFRPPASGAGNADVPDRNEVELYELWIPEADPEEYEEGATRENGFNGVIFTLGQAKNPQTGDPTQPQWIRKPRPFFGPPWGPYKLFGIHIVPGQIFPLSPLAAVFEHIQELNAHATQASRDAAAHKRFTAFDPGLEQAGRNVKNAENGDVVPVQGLGDRVQEMEIGGATEHQQNWVEVLRDRVERALGLDEASSGQANEDATATAVQEAATSRDSRLALVESMFAEATTTVLYSAAWYMWHSEFVVFPLGEEAIPDIAPRPSDLPPENDAPRVARELGISEDQARAALEWKPDLWFRGGVSEGEFDELELQIEPYSMRRMDEAVMQKRMVDTFEIVSKIAPLMLQNPQVDWRELMKRWGEAMNMRGLEEVIDHGVLTQMWQLQGYPVQEGAAQLQQMMGQNAQQMMGQGQPQQGGQQPQPQPGGGGGSTQQSGEGVPRSGNMSGNTIGAAMNAS